MLASSGTGAMEASVTNCFAPGDEVVVVNGGKFGERWTKLADDLRPQADRDPRRMGTRRAAPTSVRRPLDEHPQGARRARAGERDVDHRRAPDRADRRGHARARRAARRRRHHRGRRVRHPDGPLGHRRADHRFAEGAHAAARTGLDRAQQARLGASREDQPAALLLRPAARARPTRPRTRPRRRRRSRWSSGCARRWR